MCEGLLSCIPLRSERDTWLPHIHPVLLRTAIVRSTISRINPISVKSHPSASAFATSASSRQHRSAWGAPRASTRLCTARTRPICHGALQGRTAKGRAGKFLPIATACALYRLCDLRVVLEPRQCNGFEVASQFVASARRRSERRGLAHRLRNLGDQPRKRFTEGHPRGLPVSTADRLGNLKQPQRRGFLFLYAERQVVRHGAVEIWTGYRKRRGVIPAPVKFASIRRRDCGSLLQASAIPPLVRTDDNRLFRPAGDTSRKPCAAEPSIADATIGSILPASHRARSMPAARALRMTSSTSARVLRPPIAHRNQPPDICRGQQGGDLVKGSGNRVADR